MLKQNKYNKLLEIIRKKQNEYDSDKDKKYDSDENDKYDKYIDLYDKDPDALLLIILKDINKLSSKFAKLNKGFSIFKFYLDSKLSGNGFYGVNSSNVKKTTYTDRHRRYYLKNKKKKSYN